ncbi:MAG: zinc finger domain-containing protein [candidate division WOR-3 bacterium]
MSEEATTPRKIKCTQCGAPLDIPRGAEQITCPFCGSTIEIKRETYQGEFWAKPVFDKHAATERFFRWTAERDKPAPFNERVELINIMPVWVPTWHIKEWKASAGGAREISFSIQPGFADQKTYEALSPQNLPLQSIKPVEGSLDGEIAQKDMEPAEKLTFLKSRGINVHELSLVYVPLYRVEYSYNGKKYNMLIEGMTGGIHAVDYPKKPGWPYYLYTVAFGILFLLLSLPLFSDDPDAVSLGMTLLCAGAVISMPVSALIAYLLVKKV